MVTAVVTLEDWYLRLSPMYPALENTLEGVAKANKPLVLMPLMSSIEQLMAVIMEEKVPIVFTSRVSKIMDK